MHDVIWPPLGATGVRGGAIGKHKRRRPEGFSGGVASSMLIPCQKHSNTLGETLLIFWARHANTSAEVCRWFARGTLLPRLEHYSPRGDRRGCSLRKGAGLGGAGTMTSLRAERYFPSKRSEFSAKSGAYFGYFGYLCGWKWAFMD